MKYGTEARSAMSVPQRNRMLYPFRIAHVEIADRKGSSITSAGDASGLLGAEPPLERITQPPTSGNISSDGPRAVSLIVLRRSVGTGPCRGIEHIGILNWLPTS